MFGQNQDDQQAVVPPPDNVVSAPTAPVGATPEPPMPDDPNVIKPNTASTAELEPEVQPLSPTPQGDDLAIPDDIKDEDVKPTPIIGPATNGPSRFATSAPAVSEEPQKDTAVPALNISEDGDISTSITAKDTEDTNADLDTLKRKALDALSPLVDELDQAPEEKFQTTMMLIQANDNKDLLPKAYEAAQSITDDKVKAQALLDVVNEINYFSQDK